MAPLRYVQGPDALLQMGEQLQVLGIKNPLILASPSAKKAIGAAIAQGLDAAGDHTYALSILVAHAPGRRSSESRRPASREAMTLSSVAAAARPSIRAARCHGPRHKCGEDPSGIFPAIRGRRAVHQCPHRCGHRCVNIRCFSRLHGKGYAGSNHGVSHEPHHGLCRHGGHRQVTCSVARGRHGRCPGNLFRGGHVVQDL